LEPIFTNYIGAAITFDTIRKGLAELQMAYSERGFVTASVKLPVQQLTNGLVKVEVIQGKLTEINVTGNRYFSSNNVGRLFPSLQTNTVLNGLVFQQELDRANNNLDRQIYPVIGPGPDPGTTSLLLKVKDQLPLHGRLELDNYSTPNTPELRLNAALQYNNLWQLDHQFGVQYSFTPTEFKEGSYPFYDRPLIANYSAFYRLPLSGVNGPPRRTPYDLSQVGYDEATKRFRPPPASDVSELLFYASRSSSDTGMQLQSETLTPSVIPSAGALQVSDRLFNRALTVNENLGARFLRPLPEFKHIHSSLSFGPDYKKFHSSSEQSRVFQATIFVPETGSVGPPFTTFKSPPTKTSREVVNKVEYLPLSLNWDASITDNSGSTFFNINNAFNWSGVGVGTPPPKPIACAMPASGPRLPWPIAFITSAMFRCILRSLLTSSTLTPAPAAMRFLRLALRMSGWRRSCRVIESITATWRLMILSSIPAAAIWFFILAMPGIMPIRLEMPPIFAICNNCSRMSARSNWPLRIFSAARAAFSASIFEAAFSTSEMMSPMPRIRPAIRLG